MLMSVPTPMVAATIAAPIQLAAISARAKTAIHSMLMDTHVKVNLSASPIIIHRALWCMSQL